MGNGYRVERWQWGRGGVMGGEYPNGALRAPPGFPTPTQGWSTADRQTHQADTQQQIRIPRRGFFLALLCVGGWKANK